MTDIPEVAKRSGLDARTVRAIGPQTTVSTLAAIAGALGCEPGDLLSSNAALARWAAIYGREGSNG